MLEGGLVEVGVGMMVAWLALVRGFIVVRGDVLANRR